jgi:hypothetical protein
MVTAESQVSGCLVVIPDIFNPALREWNSSSSVYTAGASTLDTWDEEPSYGCSSPQGKAISEANWRNFNHALGEDSL